MTANRTPPGRTPAHAGNGDARGDPREVGELLATWVGAKLEEVDALAEQARAKVAAIPDRQVLAQVVGELILRVYMLEHDVAELRKGARR
jgi:hypothetical protein